MLYQLASGDRMPGGILVATIMEHAPKGYRDVLRNLPMGSRSPYHDLRDCLKEWLRATLS